jgi:hypothetical protein
LKKNNSDNDIAAEREQTLKVALRSANKTITILRISCKDAEMLGVLTQEAVPESTTKTQRLDESAYIRDKMTLREAAAGLTTLFDKADDAAFATAEI